MELEKQARSTMAPHQFLHITMDATDQLPFGIPHFAQILKGEKTTRMKVKLMIAIAHGVGVWTYFMPPFIREDPNWTIECLQRTLKHVETEKGRLPQILSLQFDNCRGQNKNTALFCYLASLVERGVFKRIYVSFLPVGHTHNVADQVGSRYSIACRVRDICSLADMMAIVKMSYKPQPTCEITRVRFIVFDLISLH